MLKGASRGHLPHLRSPSYLFTLGQTKFERESEDVVLGVSGGPRAVGSLMSPVFLFFLPGGGGGGWVRFFSRPRQVSDRSAGGRLAERRAMDLSSSWTPNAFWVWPVHSGSKKLKGERKRKRNREREWREVER